MSLPDEDLGALDELAAILEGSRPVVAVTTPDGRFVRLPVGVCGALADVVGAMRDGYAVSVGPVKSTLTPQETADYLGVSRPEVLELFDSGQIPFERPAVGRHRRVQLGDLIDYQSRQAQERAQLFR